MSAVVDGEEDRVSVTLCIEVLDGKSEFVVRDTVSTRMAVGTCSLLLFEVGAGMALYSDAVGLSVAITSTTSNRRKEIARKGEIPPMLKHTDI